MLSVKISKHPAWDGVALILSSTAILQDISIVFKKDGGLFKNRKLTLPSL